jgi:hypothetical protein
MPKKLSPKQSFLLLCLSTGAGILTPFLLMNLDVIRLLYGLPFFLLPFIIIFATFFVAMAMPRIRTALSKLEIPKRYSPKHFLLLMWLTGQAFLLGVILHNGVYALFWHLVCRFLYGYVCAGDEPIFFIIAVIVVPAGFAIGAIGRIWEWAVVKPVEEMKGRGIHLPTAWRYFAPIGCCAWLWRFSKGVESITEGKMGARRVFAAVFLLGVIGFVIVRWITQRQLAKIPIK